MVASSDTSLPKNVIEPKATAPLRLLRAAAIYGANASGKTNVLKALDFVRWMVVYSQTRLESKDSPIGVVPFALDPKWSQRPSRFEIQFIHNSVRTAYGFTVNRKHVLNEWLTTYPRGKRRILFVRTIGESDKPSVEFGRSLVGTKKNQLVAARATRKNSLVLSAAAQTNFEQIATIYEWFSKRLVTVFPEDRPLNLEALMTSLIEKKGFKEKILRLLSFADLGIVDLKTRTSKLPDELVQHLKDSLKPKFFEKLKETIPEIKELTLVHKAGANAETTLDFEQESRGTHNLLALIGPILTSFDNGATLCVDEFTASLHPHVARDVIEFINFRRASGKAAQLIFASHDTNLFDNKLFRRDQCWFTEKDDEGATHLYPLSDFHPRKGENFARGYLQGRYGAIPLTSLLDLKNAADSPAILDRAR